MKKVLLVFLGVLAYVAAADLWNETDWQIFEQDKDITPESRGLILNSQGRRIVRKILRQLPYGWPDYGIPPLAPYKNPNLELHFAKSAMDTQLQFLNFRFDGLDEMDIKKLKVSYTFDRKVKFNFNYKELVATADTLNHNVSIDLMDQLGVSVLHEGSGPLQFILENLSVRGQFKYKVPFVIGSIRMYKFKCTVSLGDVHSNIGGLLGNGRLNEKINDEIENYVHEFINSHEHEICDMIEKNLVPRVNAHFKGHKIWYLFRKLLGI